MDPALGFGLISVIGVATAVYYGRRSRSDRVKSAEVEAALIRYREMEDVIQTLRAAEEVTEQQLRDFEALKDEVFHLRSATAASEEALKLARAAETLHQKKTRLKQFDPPLGGGTYMAEGDRRSAVAELKNEFRELYGESPGAEKVSAKYHDNANLTLITVRGGAWRQLIEAKAEWRLVEPAKAKDYVSLPLLQWVREYCRVATSQKYMDVGMRPDPSGETLLIELTDSAGVVHGLALVATLEDHKPVCVAEYFSGSPEAIDEWFMKWCARNRAPIV